MVEAGLTSQSSLGVWLRAPAVHRRSHTGSRRIACSSLAAEEHRLCGWSPRVGRGAPCITRNCARGRHSHIYNIRSSSARRAAWCTGRPQFPDGCKWCDGCSSRAERHFAHHKEVRREVTPCLPHRCHQQRPELFPSPAVCPSNPQEESHRQQTHHSLEPHHRAAQALWLEPPARQRRFAHRKELCRGHTFTHLQHQKQQRASRSLVPRQATIPRCPQVMWWVLQERLAKLRSRAAPALRLQLQDRQRPKPEVEAAVAAWFPRSRWPPAERHLPLRDRLPVRRCSAASPSWPTSAPR